MKSHIRKAGLCVGLVAIVAAMAAIQVSQFARAADEKSAAANIAIDNFSFNPREITVAKGTIVTWVNHDDVPHTVVSPDKKFKSKALDTDDQFSFTFNDSGSYAYFCSVHPMMTGKVIVK